MSKFDEIPRLMAEHVPTGSGEPTHAGVALRAADTGRMLLIQRSLDPTDPPEVQGTWEFPGGTIEEGETPEAAAWREFSEETGLPQPQGETVNGWRSEDGIYQGFVFEVPVEAEAFDFLNPDADAAHTVNPDDPERRTPDVSAWFTLEQMQNLGPALRPEVAAMDWSVFDQQKEDDMPEPDFALTAAAPAPPVDDISTMWHGVITVEGKESGDKRGFRKGALSTRPLPLPLTWQKTSADGHDQNVVVATIDRLAMVNSEQRGEGRWLLSPESNEVQGMIAEFGKFGVSVDADKGSFDVDALESEGILWFDSARSCGACIVSIPAFHEAYVALGPAPDDFFDGAEDRTPEGTALVASGNPFWDQFADVAPGITEDGPGWLTNPVDTDRLRDYWTHGEGAAKIAWGTPGDFNRCRVNLAQYVKPEYLSGYCANRHYDALGVWPGQEMNVRDTLKETDMSPSVSLVAAGVPTHAPAEWFKNPEFAIGDGRLVYNKESDSYGCPQTITEEGHIFGHIAVWKECHASWAESKCVIAPRSQTNYAHFLLGEVLTTEGPVATGCLTVGGGHAPDGLRARAAREHYDNTCAVYGDVTVGEDEFGIWMSGWVRPGTTPEMVHAARASKPSGDWRRIGTSMEMIAALAVNTPGFRVPRISAAVENGELLSLCAAGVVVADTPESDVDVSLLASQVAEQVMARMAAKAQWDSVQAALADATAATIEKRRQAMGALASKVKE